jgi:hypothetical protein
MKQALEALEQIKGFMFHPAKVFSWEPSIIALRAAIEQAEKPVAWRWKEVKGEFVGDWVLTEIEPPPYVTESMPLYTAPREWVELTEEETQTLYDRHAVYQEYDAWESGWFDFAKAIEAKLKEKNNV